MDIPDLSGIWHRIALRSLGGRGTAVEFVRWEARNLDKAVEIHGLLFPASGPALRNLPALSAGTDPGDQERVADLALKFLREC